MLGHWLRTTKGMEVSEIDKLPLRFVVFECTKGRGLVWYLGEICGELGARQQGVTQAETFCPHGVGIEYDPNTGFVYVGDHVYGMRHGQCILHESDSTVFEGRVSEGRCHGNGKLLIGYGLER